MYLYIKQHVFTWSDTFSVYDENGNEAFYVKGEVFSFGKKLHIFDLNGNELAFIEQKVFSWYPKYLLYRGDMFIGEVVRTFSWLRPSYHVNGLDWQIEGDYFAHEYEVSDCGMSIARVTKEWFSFGDAYQISIADGVDPINALAVVLVVDACIEADNN